MPYREVTMLEVKEVLRLWLAGVPKKRVAAQLGLDPKTVRRLIAAAEAQGLHREAGEAGLTDEVLVALQATSTKGEFILVLAPKRFHGV